MPRPGYDSVVLVTGFPSFLARWVLRQILSSEPGAYLYVLVRQDARDEAEEVLSGLPSEERDRVSLIEGDAAAMDLGLSGQEFRGLAAEVDRIHHVAHASYLGIDRAEAERLNIGGVSEVLELAGACRSLSCLVHYSTTQVAGDRTGSVREDELEAGQHFPTLIAETRARGEMLARKAMARIPIAIVRPATIVGDSKTGQIDRFDGPYLFILLMVTSPPDLAIPLPGRGETPLHLCPVDYVATAAHAIGRDRRAPGRTFHLVDPNPLTSRRVFELVATAAERPAPKGNFPANLARALLRTPGLERFAKSPRAFVEQLTTDVAFDARNTEAILSGTGIQCPPFETYVHNLVDYVRERVRERRTRSDRAHETEADWADAHFEVDRTPSSPTSDPRKADTNTGRG